MRTFDDMLAKQLQNEDFRKEYEAIQPEMELKNVLINDKLLVIVFLKLLLLNVMENKFLLLQKVFKIKKEKKSSSQI